MWRKKDGENYLEDSLKKHTAEKKFNRRGKGHFWKINAKYKIQGRRSENLKEREGSTKKMWLKPIKDKLKCSDGNEKAELGKNTQPSE